MTPDYIYQDLNLLRAKNPVVHNMTNFVAMSTIANVLLALGASPIMAHEENELADIIQIANSLVINIGTLDENWIQLMKKAQIHAQKKCIPIILDPVGAGATALRTRTAREFLQLGVQIVRGNASEIMALVDDTHTANKGVDSTEKTFSAIEAAKQIAKKYHCIVVVSGETDIITDGQKQYHIQNGTPIFTKVTAMGCSATAVIGAFAAIQPDYLKAAASAMTAFTLAGENAEKNSNGPGTFSLFLLDSLAKLDRVDFDEVKIKFYEN